MLFTAAVMICLQDAPKNYQTCQIVNAHFKYMSEEHCWKAINAWVAEMNDVTLKNNHLIVDAKCIEWLEAPKQNKL